MRRPALLGAFVLLSLCGAVAAAADARSYRDGLNALADGRFTDAERYFREAIAERSEERSGGIRRTYLPHYYLGVTLAEMKRCAEALEAWKVSEKQGQVQRSDEEGKELPTKKQRCLDRLRAVESARTAAEQAVARARKASQTLSRMREKPELSDQWSEGERSFAAREVQARSRLEDAARLLGVAAGEDPAPFQESKSMANEAASAFDEIRSEAQARLGDLRDAASNALQRLEATEARARAVLGELAPLEPFPPELRRRAVVLNQALEETVKRKAEAGAPELGRLRQTLDEAAGHLSEAAKGPPTTLRAAVEAFLEGRHDDVLATLAGESFKDPRAAGQACLLQAASRFELQRRADERNPERAALLREEVVACRDLVEAAKIPPRFFSPRFIRFYENPPEPPESAAGAAEGDPPAAGAEDEAPVAGAGPRDPG